MGAVLIFLSSSGVRRASWTEADQIIVRSNAVEYDLFGYSISYCQMGMYLAVSVQIDL